MRAILLDYEGRAIRLPEERWQHILSQHSIMIGREDVIGICLLDPDEIRLDPDDPDTVKLYYRWFEGALAGNRRYVVAVKFLNGDAYVLTHVPPAIANQGRLYGRRELHKRLV